MTPGPFDGFGVDCMWTAICLVSIETMRQAALRFYRARRAARYLLCSAVLIGVSLVARLGADGLRAAHAPRPVHVSVAVGGLLASVAGGVCLVVGVLLLLGSLRPPRGPRRRRRHGRAWQVQSVAA